MRRLGLRFEETKESFGFAGYYADTEYNRKQNGKVKTIIDGDAKVIPITCDLIIHSRGEISKGDNLIAIEMKKTGRPPKETVADRNRLMALTRMPNHGVWSADGSADPEHVCGYKLGLFIEIDSRNRTYRIEEFRFGSQVAVSEGAF